MKTAIYIFILGLIFTACTTGNVNISGKIEGADNINIVLRKMNVDNIITIDSTQTSKSGKFKFNFDLTEPVYLSLNIDKNPQITFVAFPDSSYHLEADITNIIETYKFENNKDAMLIKEFNKQLSSTKQKKAKFEELYQKYSKDEKYAKQRQNVILGWDSVYTDQKNYSKTFILDNAMSLVAYYSLYQKLDKENYILDPIADFHYYKVVTSAIQVIHPSSQYTKAIQKHVEQINSAIRNDKLASFIQNSKASIPEIELPDIKGDTISLRSIKSKLVVLDYTLLNSKEGIQNAEELKSIYSKYHHKGLEIYQVCLDKDLAQWQNAVKVLGIKWKCVRDGDGEYSRAAAAWNVKRIPANYIFNSDYEVVGKDIYDRRLEDRLNDLIQK